MTIRPEQSITVLTVVFVVSLVVLLSAGFTADYGWGSDQESAVPAITLDVQNEPLRSVLGKISKTTRWKIKAPDKWLDKPVTQTLNKATLEEGLRSVLKGAGIEDLLLLYDENIKEITLFDTEGPQKQAASRPVAQTNTQQRVVSTTGQPDPILERARLNAERGSSQRNRRSRRRAAPEEP